MKTRWVIILVLLGLAVFLFYRFSIPRSAQIRQKMNSVLNDEVKNDFTILREYELLQGDLAEAYIEENRPDDAIEVLKELIRINHGRRYVPFAGERPRMSFDYYVEGRYYDALARAFELKKDFVSRDKAIKKSEQAFEMEKVKKKQEDEALLD